MNSFEAVAPTRVDLAGGTLDIAPVYLLLDDPLTVNLALALPARVTVRRRDDGRVTFVSEDHGSRQEFPDAATATAKARHRLAAEALRALPLEGGADIATRSGVPTGSGLGGSSALAVALCAALRRARGERIERTPLALFASSMEGRVIGVPPGSQDHLGSAHGGVSAWHYGLHGVRREPLAVDVARLARRLVLAYTGVSHSSAENNWRVVRGFFDGDRGIRRGFADIAAAARDARQAVLEEDGGALAAAMDRDSRARRHLFPGFHTERTLMLARAARRAGAIGGRPCGAGGGGSMVFVVEDDGAHASVSAALTRQGATVLPVLADLRGVRVRRLP
jgi:D-glycero-alpha-D-manno-heptose-7-phosphate kinase